MRKTAHTTWLSTLLCAVLIAAMALMTAACGDTQTTGQTDTASQTDTAGQTEPAGQNDAAEPTSLGEGETTFSLTVTDPEGTETSYEIHTDATTVGDALESLDLIAGEEGSYGLFVTTVDGVTLPSDGDQYWAFYIDGEYASTGVDQTEITAGASYALKAESM